MRFKLGFLVVACLMASTTSATIACAKTAPPKATAKAAAITIPPAPKDFVLPGDKAAGSSVYKMYCAACHGAKGKGDGIVAANLPVKPRDFTNATEMAKLTDWRMYFTIAKGGKATGISELMTPWEGILTDEEIGSTTQFIRSFTQPETKK